MTRCIAVVLAGGLGTRMRSARPKLLHELCGRPMLAYVLDAARTATGTDPVVVVSPATVAVRDAFSTAAAFAQQERPDGTGDALRAGLAVVPAAVDEVVVLSGDVPLVEASLVAALLERRREVGATLALVSFETWEPARLGRVIRTSDGERVARVVEAEDATADELAVGEVNAGIYAFEAAWLRTAIDRLTPSPATGELYLTQWSTLPTPTAGPSSPSRRRTTEPRRHQRPGPAGGGDGHPARAAQPRLAPRRGHHARPGNGLCRRRRRAGPRRDPRSQRRPSRPDAHRRGHGHRVGQPAGGFGRRRRVPRLGQRPGALGGGGGDDDRPLQPPAAGQLDRPRRRARQLRRGEETAASRPASCSTT